MRFSTLDIRNSQITNGTVLKAQDILVVLKLASASSDASGTFASVAESLSMSASEVFAATQRALACRLLSEQPQPGIARFRPSAPNLQEFLVSGLRYVFPGEIGKPARGFRTAQSVQPLSLRFPSAPNELPIVWPHSDGDTRGYSLKPLYRSVPDAARRDQRLYTWLALADAVRTGDARIRREAFPEIEKLITELNVRIR